MLTYDQIIQKIDQLEEAKILLAGLELKIFTVLGKGRYSAPQVAKKARTHREGTEMLLNALVALGALRLNKNLYSNTPVTYKHFCVSSKDYKKGTVMLRKEHRHEWDDLINIVRNGRDLSQYEGGDDPEFRWLFTHAMHERSFELSGKKAQAITRKPVGRLLDLAGGPGSYSVAILRKDKKASATLFDRSATLRVAREIIKETGYLKRFKFIEGDLFKTDYGNHYDTVLFSNVLHIYNPKENKILFRKIYRCLNEGGRFILVDYFLKDNRNEPYNAALFSLTMLLFTATGKSYTYSETEKILRATGFVNLKRFKVGEGVGIIEAVKK
ncbi:MAG: methyltransferase [Nitrospinales bacterium]